MPEPSVFSESESVLLPSKFKHSRSLFCCKQMLNTHVNENKPGQLLNLSSLTSRGNWENDF